MSGKTNNPMSEDNGALAFLEDLDHDERRALKQLAEKRASESVGRRDAIKSLGLGALAVGAGSGAGYAARDAVAPVSAQSTSDSVGDIGTPSDPVDVFAAGVSADELSTPRVDNKQRPANIYIFKDGSDNVAVDSGGTELARSTSPGPVFQAACDALPGSGGRIDVGRGTFTFSQGFTIGVPTELVGRGMAHPVQDGPTKLKYADGMDATMITVSADTRASWTSTTTIENLTIDGENTTNTVGHGVYVDGQPDTQINRVLFWYCPERSIFVENGHQEVWITNSWIEHSGDANIWIDGGHASFITNNYIIDGGTHNIAVLNTRDVTITNNTIDDAVNNHNITIQDSTNFTIANNPRIQNGAKTGITVFGSSANQIDHGVIMGNSIRNNSTGLELRGAGTVDNVIAIGNTIDGNTTNINIGSGKNPNGIVRWNPPANNVVDTRIKAGRSTNVTGITAGTWTDVGDTELRDSTGELNSSFEFVPTYSGWYDIEASAHWQNVTDQDQLQIAVRDITNAAIVSYSFMIDRASGTDDYVTGSTSVELTAGTTYKVQTRNPNNSGDLKGDNSTYYTIERQEKF